MSPAIATISAHAFEDEALSVQHLLEQLSHMPALEKAIMAKAEGWATDLRRDGPSHGMEAFLQTYGLDTREGIALMCLAEALLRIPDNATADQLIQNTFEGKDWREHIRGDEPWLTARRAGGFGLPVKSSAIRIRPSSITNALRGLTSKLGEPVVRQALKQAMLNDRCTIRARRNDPRRARSCKIMGETWLSILVRYPRGRGAQRRTGAWLCAGLPRGHCARWPA